MKSFIAASLFASLALATPTPTLKARSTQICGQWDTVATGTYTVYQDLWNEDAATSGSQCTTVESLSGTTLKWETEWSWAGASSSVKSFANAVASITSKEISAYSSMESTWDWSYTGSDIVADVAYDIFTGTSSDSSTVQYEIMIWLAALGGAGPISSTGSAIATPTIAGHTWSLYKGPNGDTTVYSFVASSEITSFSGDLLEFFSYLEENEGYSSSQYLQSVGAGSEPFTGSDAVFSTSGYSLTVE